MTLRLSLHVLQLLVLSCLDIEGAFNAQIRNENVWINGRYRWNKIGTFLKDTGCPDCLLKHVIMEKFYVGRFDAQI